MYNDFLLVFSQVFIEVLFDRFSKSELNSLPKHMKYLLFIAMWFCFDLKVLILCISNEFKNTMLYMYKQFLAQLPKNNEMNTVLMILCLCSKGCIELTFSRKPLKHAQNNVFHHVSLASLHMVVFIHLKLLLIRMLENTYKILFKTRLSNNTNS